MTRPPPSTTTFPRKVPGLGSRGFYIRAFAKNQFSRYAAAAGETFRKTCTVRSFVRYVRVRAHENMHGRTEFDGKNPRYYVPVKSAFVEWSVQNEKITTTITSTHDSPWAKSGPTGKSTRPETLIVILSSSSSEKINRPAGFDPDETPGRTYRDNDQNYSRDSEKKIKRFFTTDRRPMTVRRTCFVPPSPSFRRPLKTEPGDRTWLVNRTTRSELIFLWLKKTETGPCFNICARLRLDGAVPDRTRSPDEITGNVSSTLLCDGIYSRRAYINVTNVTYLSGLMLVCSNTRNRTRNYFVKLLKIISK